MFNKNNIIFLSTFLLISNLIYGMDDSSIISEVDDKQLSYTFELTDDENALVALPHYCLDYFVTLKHFIADMSSEELNSSEPIPLKHISAYIFNIFKGIMQLPVIDKNSIQNYLIEYFQVEDIEEDDIELVNDYLVQCANCVNFLDCELIVQASLNMLQATITKFSHNFAKFLKNAERLDLCPDLLSQLSNQILASCVQELARYSHFYLAQTLENMVPVRALALSGNGKKVVWASGTYLFAYDLQKKSRSQINPISSRFIEYLSLNNEGNFLAIGMDSRAYLIDLNSNSKKKRIIKTINCQGTISALTLSETVLIIGLASGRILILDLKSKELMSKVYNGITSRINYIFVCSDEKTYFTASDDGLVWVLQLKNVRFTDIIFMTPRYRLKNIAASSDGKKVFLLGKNFYENEHKMCSYLKNPKRDNEKPYILNSILLVPAIQSMISISPSGNTMIALEIRSIFKDKINFYENDNYDYSIQCKGLNGALLAAARNSHIFAVVTKNEKINIFKKRDFLEIQSKLKDCSYDTVCALLHISKQKAQGQKCLVSTYKKYLLDDLQKSLIEWGILNK